MAENPEMTPDVEENRPELESLRKELADAKAKSAEYYDQLLRLKAEFENFRKRVEREKSESRAWGKQDVLLELISLVDVFEQAMAQVQNAKDLKHVVQGVEMLHKSFTQFLKEEGLEPMDLVGKPLDPHRAEAIEQEEVEADRAGQVLAELQKGHLFQWRVLRSNPT